MSGLKVTGVTSRAGLSPVSVTARSRALDAKAELSRTERINSSRILPFSLTSNFGKIYSEPVKNHIVGLRVSSRQNLKLLSCKLELL